MLELLNDGSAEDAVGLEAEELTAHQIAVCERLVGKDLVRFDIGWRYSCWFRLTPAGREALRLLRSEDRRGAARASRSQSVRARTGTGGEA
ncbi:hypothetical protein [Aureimonas endophytica]|nr:hypothetical protein [Aureimonas endophytica]